jgi:hypothetical protein
VTKVLNLPLLKIRVARSCDNGTEPSFVEDTSGEVL